MHTHLFISCIRKWENLVHTKNGVNPLVALNPRQITFLGDNGYWEDTMAPANIPQGISLPLLRTRASRAQNIPQDFVTCFSAFTRIDGIKQLFDTYYSAFINGMRIRTCWSDHEYGVNNYMHNYVSNSSMLAVGCVDQTTTNAHSLALATGKTSICSGTAVNTFDTTKVIPVHNPANADTPAPQYGGFQTTVYPAGEEASRTPVGYWREGYYSNGVHTTGAFPDFIEYFYVDAKTSCDPYTYLTEPTRKLIGSVQEDWLINAVLNSVATWKVIICDKPFWGWPNSPVAGYPSYAPELQDDGWQVNFTQQRDRICLALKNVDGLVYIGGDDHTALAINKSPVSTDPTYDANYPKGLISFTCPSWRSNARPTGAPSTVPPVTNTAMKSAGVIWGFKTWGVISLDADMTKMTVFFRTVEEAEPFTSFTINAGVNKIVSQDTSYLATTGFTNSPSGDITISLNQDQPTSDAYDTALNSINNLRLISSAGINTAQYTFAPNIPIPPRNVSSFTYSCNITETISPFRIITSNRTAYTNFQPEVFQLFTIEELNRSSKFSLSPTTRLNGNNYNTTFSSTTGTNNRPFYDANGLLTYTVAAGNYDSFYGWEGWIVPNSEPASNTTEANYVTDFGGLGGFTPSVVPRADGTGTASAVYGNFTYGTATFGPPSARLISVMVYPNGTNDGFLTVVDPAGPTVIMRVPLNLFEINKWTFVNLGYNIYDKYVVANSGLFSGTLSYFAGESSANYLLSFISGPTGSSTNAYSFTGRMLPSKTSITGRQGVTREYTLPATYTNNFSFSSDFVLPPVSLVSYNTIGIASPTGPIARIVGIRNTTLSVANPTANTGINVEAVVGVPNSYIRVGMGIATPAPLGVTSYYNSKTIPELSNPIENKLYRVVVSKTSLGVSAWLNGELILDTAVALGNALVPDVANAPTANLNTAVGFIALGTHFYSSDTAAGALSTINLISKDVSFFSPNLTSATALAFSGQISSGSSGGSGSQGKILGSILN